MLKGTRFTATSAMVAGIALAVAGVIIVTDTQSSQSTVVGIEHVSLAGLSLACLAMIAPFRYLARLAGASKAAVVAPVGLVALALISLISNIRGEDLSIFPAVAGPANLMIFGGFLAVGIRLRRRAGLPLALAIGLPFSWILTIPASAIGGCVFAGAFWMTVAYLIANQGLGRTEMYASPHEGLAATGITE
jgi:hypothetical protein